MRSALSLLALVVLPVLALTACAGTDNSIPVATNQVTMVKSYRFDPTKIVVDAGTTVTWTNEDNFTHTVQVDGQDDHKVERGESFSITFDKPGTYHYVCTLHSKDMSGEVIVE